MKNKLILYGFLTAGLSATIGNIAGYTWGKAREHQELATRIIDEDGDGYIDAIVDQQWKFMLVNEKVPIQDTPDQSYTICSLIGKIPIHTTEDQIHKQIYPQIAQCLNNKTY